MLIKFLSSVVSGFGARYKVLIPAVILAVSLGGVSAVLINTRTAATAASTISKSSDDLSLQKLGTQLGYTVKRTVDNQTAASTTPTNTAATQNAPSATTTPNNQTSSNSQPAATPFDVAISPASSFTLMFGASKTITAQTTDGSAVNWTINDPQSNIQVNPTSSTNPTTSFSFTVTATQTATSGSSYQVNVNAQDSSRMINVTKTINITVQ